MTVWQEPEGYGNVLKLLRQELIMKTLGIIGGIGPESTIIYYRGLILGGTELSIIFNEVSAAAVRVLDTTTIHIAAAIEC